VTQDDDVGDDPPLRLVEDDASLFGRLFDRHAPSLHAYLCSRVGRSAADDLVAEVFLVAYRDRGRFDPGRGDVRAWLFGIATNLARRHQRTELRGLAAVARFGSAGVAHVDELDRRVPEKVDAAAQVGRLAEALVALPPGDRDVLLLTAWAGLSSVEVAAALEVPVGTVRSRLHRVRRHLRSVLDEEGRR
jgi:RNA polymerase sigma-70 factor (ECF subfamily)